MFCFFLLSLLCFGIVYYFCFFCNIKFLTEMAENILSNDFEKSSERKDDSLEMLQDCNLDDLPYHVKLAQEAIHKSGYCEQEISQADILVAVTYSLMLECGFVPYEHALKAAPSRGYHRNNIRQFSEPPKQWRCNGCYLLKFSLALCPSMQVRFLAVPSSGSLLLTVSALSHIGNSICIQLDHFVVPSKVADREILKLCNVRELAFTIKDKLCNPARCDVLKAFGMENPSLMGLPFEVIAHIVTFLPAEDLVRFGSVCRILYDITSNQKLWMSLVRKDFCLVALAESNDKLLNWKAEYGSLHNHKKRARRQHASIRHTPYFMV